ncbi:mannose-6-phosphate isomerase, class I [Vibrio hangzhouensis]|uniref:mannose-6-phosphate isomerase n=1 Tax=Vibrio hangzhouensis TaxID=462991 RepID=A0A1H5TIJ8_9VIBR|nr:mannose-6-phosphate isomerase, class I [Vibrio hangzhouensis]SEF62594.1 mannose-6-phosphate isomerase, type 1 [Vibrio hangzhouensis]
MSNKIHRLKNQIQRYHWGTRTSIPVILRNARLATNEPLAEYWISSHPLLPSFIDETGESLTSFLANQNEDQKALPFIVKLLSANTPLSIQVHPSKEQALEGFLNENRKGIGLTDSTRNYKDNNHKPETIIALTTFEALVGFRTKEAIIQDVTTIDNKHLSLVILNLATLPEHKFLEKLMQWLLSRSPNTIQCIVNDLIGKKQKLNLSAINTISLLSEEYGNDVGVLMALILNKVSLNPNESLYIKEGIPHAYLNGTGIEVMASSDNVLRAGLTPKHVDIEELLNITTFQHYLPRIEQVQFQVGAQQLTVPTPDYQIEILTINNAPFSFETTSSGEILFVISGDLQCDKQHLQQGDSFVTTPNTNQLLIEGVGKVMRVYNKLKNASV